jgi:serine/threonine-protein kinase RsbW
MSARRIKLAIKSALEDVSLVGMAINKICSVIPLSDVEAYQAELCVVEACTNAIKHAYNHSANHDVEVVISMYIDRITFAISDTGKAMEKREIPTLDFDPNDLESIPEGGMGLFIMNGVMDAVDYSSAQGKNTLTMTKFFAPNDKRKNP